MNWVCDFTSNAKEDLRALPKAIRKRMVRVAAQMVEAPFRGNAKALQGEAWKGVFRRRIGDYRIPFTADHATKTIVIHQISLRSGKTYR